MSPRSKVCGRAKSGFAEQNIKTSPDEKHAKKIFTQCKAILLMVLLSEKNNWRTVQAQWFEMLRK